MMGRLTERDRELIGNAVEGIAMSDIGMIQDAVMALGDFKEPVSYTHLVIDKCILYY